MTDRIGQLLFGIGGKESIAKMQGDLAAAESEARLPPEMLAGARWVAYCALVRSLIGDSALNDDEFKTLQNAEELLDLKWEDLVDHDSGLFNERLAARIRACGPQMMKESSGILLASDEYLTYSFNAALYEDVYVQSFGAVTGEAGVSVPVTKSGVEVNASVGGLAGQSVPVLTEQMADSGLFYITTQRVVYLGSRKTVDLPIRDITGVEGHQGRLTLHSRTSQANIEFSMFEANVAEATIEWLMNPPAVTPPAPPPIDAEYPVLSKRDFAKIIKDPTSAQGKTLTIHGLVLEFNASTGPETFRARVSNELIPADKMSELDDDALFHGDSKLLADVVEEDLFEARVSVTGTFTYQTLLGGTRTIPSFVVGSISVCNKPHQTG